MIVSIATDLVVRATALLGAGGLLGNRCDGSGGRRLDSADPECHGRTPRAIIDRERARLAEGMSGHDARNLDQ
jgi:hypothetical protein